MSFLPKLAIVGRPNVGKSALFNRICGKRIAIVDEAEGITRDRLYCTVEAFGVHFELVDTGGINPFQSNTDVFAEDICKQTLVAIEEADALIMVVDVQVGVTELDRYVARLLLESKKPVVLAVNKVDSLNKLWQVEEFRALGIKHLIGVSVSHGIQISELLELATVTFPRDQAKPEEERIRFAVIGRPNVGKSTFVNSLLQEERCLVNAQVGTTRDSVDVDCLIDGDKCTLIDTAGIRHKGTEKEVVECFSAMRTERAIERADICVILLDCQQGVTAAEKRIIRHVAETRRGCIVLLNKWDLVQGFRMEHCVQSIRKENPSLSYLPFLCISAKDGRNVAQVPKLIKEVYHSFSSRIATGVLNKFLSEKLQQYHPPVVKTGKRLRIYYVAQVGVKPPRFVFFVNNPAYMTKSYERYLVNALCKEFSLKGVTVNVHLRGKEHELSRFIPKKKEGVGVVHARA